MSESATDAKIRDVHSDEDEVEEMDDQQLQRVLFLQHWAEADWVAAHERP